jgi:hypothetical protein
MNSSIHNASQVYLLSNIKAEGLSWNICKEMLENSSHQHLMESKRKVNMLRSSCWACRNISNCTTIHQTLKKELPFIIFKEKHLCGGIN